MSQTTGKYRPANISSSVVFYPTIYSRFRAVKGHLWTISHWKSTIYKVLGHFMKKMEKASMKRTESCLTQLAIKCSKLIIERLE